MPKKEKPWPDGEPTDEEKFWHQEHDANRADPVLYWFPVRGGRLFTFFYPGEAQPAPTMTFVPAPKARV